MKKTNRKIFLITVIFSLMFLVVIVRLFKLQIIDDEKYKFIVKKQTTSRELIKPVRGIIYDRNMKPLAVNRFSVTVSAIPKKIKNPDSTAAILGSIFNKDKSEYLNILQSKSENEVFLEKSVKIDDSKNIDNLRIEGLTMKKSSYRYYNYGKISAQVTGFTDEDGRGRSGIEQEYDRELSGSCGLMVLQRDGMGNKRPFQGYYQKYPKAGDNIVLTIDLNLQQIAEEELEKGISQYGAKSGKAVIMSVKTGEILAICSAPGFDPNNIRTEDTIGMKNRAFTDMTEPGSTFKIVTASGVIEENLVNKNTVINTENGKYEKNGIVITDVHGSPSMTVKEVIEKSSNIGAAKLGEILDKEKFYKYERNFGIGTYACAEYSGETKGFLKNPKEYKNGTLQFNAIGYEVLVSPLQIATAYTAIANKGILLKPLLVKKRISPEGNILAENQPMTVRQVISEKTAQTVNEFLKGVIEEGTGKTAKLENVQVAGKTGTVQKINNGEFNKNVHNSSFIGYFPADNPTILIAVFLDEMAGGLFYGGDVSAPVFKSIADRVIDYVGISRLESPDVFNEGANKFNDVHPETLNAENTENVYPELCGMDLRNAINVLQNKKIKFEIEGKKDFKKDEKRYIVVSQKPSSGESVQQGNAVVYLEIKEMKNETSGKSEKILPEVTNMSLRKALSKLSLEGFTVKIVSGSGYVISQQPEAGSEVTPGSVIKLICKEN